MPITTRINKSMYNGVGRAAPSSPGSAKNYIRDTRVSKEHKMCFVVNKLYNFLSDVLHYILFFSHGQFEKGFVSSTQFDFFPSGCIHAESSSTSTKPNQTLARK